MSSQTPVTLGYWRIRGLRQPIVYCLEFAGIEYTEELYDIVPDSEGKYNFESSYKDSKWGSEVKPNSDMDFPNLPYLVDGDIKITQCKAIMSHVCRKAKVLVPTSDKSQTKMEMMVGVLGDFHMAFVRICYGGIEGALEAYLKDEKFSDWCKKLNKYFSANQFCAGDELTWCDMYMYEVLDVHMELCGAEVFAEFQELTKYHAKIGSLEKIKAYRDSERFFKRPCNNLSAKFY